MCHKADRDLRYENLNSLLKQDARAKSYYMTLGEQGMGAANLHADCIHSFDDLKSFVEREKL